MTTCISKVVLNKMLGSSVIVSTAAINPITNNVAVSSVSVNNPSLGFSEIVKGIQTLQASCSRAKIFDIQLAKSLHSKTNDMSTSTVYSRKQRETLSLVSDEINAAILSFYNINDKRWYNTPGLSVACAYYAAKDLE